MSENLLPETEAVRQKYLKFPIESDSELLIWNHANAMEARAEAAEAEIAAWRDLRDVSTQMVPGEHGEGEEIDPTPNSIRDHLKYLQEEWNVAERNLGNSNRELAKRSQAHAEDLKQLSASKAEVERLKDGLRTIGFYFAGTDHQNIADITLRLISGESMHQIRREALAKTGWDRE